MIWRKTGAEQYLQGLRSLRPDVQRRAAELFATLGPRISKVEEAAAESRGWKSDHQKRIWDAGEDRSSRKITSLPLLGNVPVQSFGRRLRCEIYGHLGYDALPNWSGDLDEVGSPLSSIKPGVVYLMGFPKGLRPAKYADVPL